VRTARRGYPEEICGFLIGQASGEDKAVNQLLPIENIREENRPPLRDFARRLFTARTPTRALPARPSWVFITRIPTIRPAPASTTANTLAVVLVHHRERFKAAKRPT
jgi:hypothetical protein